MGYLKNNVSDHGSRHSLSKKLHERKSEFPTLAFGLYAWFYGPFLLFILNALVLLLAAELVTSNCMTYLNQQFRSLKVGGTDHSALMTEARALLDRVSQYISSLRFFIIRQAH